MPKEKTAPMTHAEAINLYYGGVHNLAKMGFPFTCKCGGRSYRKMEGEEEIRLPVMSTADCFKHIRKEHRERIKKVQ